MKVVAYVVGMPFGKTDDATWWDHDSSIYVSYDEAQASVARWRELGYTRKIFPVCESEGF